MADYRAPIKDMQFVLNEVLKANEFWQQSSQLNETIDSETAKAILEEAAKLAENEVAPIARAADEQGVSFQNGEVTTPEGYKNSFSAIADGGWIGLSGDPAYGGLAMPKLLTVCYEEILSSADMAFSMYPSLTTGASMAILASASDSLKATYLPKMYSGQWMGTMCLTEAHSGTDLGLINSKAVDNGDGSYNITGSKVFISSGEHDLTENIVHLVLAKLPDAPKGSRGISLFLVPKYHVNTDGSLGEKNFVSCGSIEHKMGIHGSSTCVMNFDSAKGFLVGEINKGLAAMFIMMNYQRMTVGVLGVACAERSYQNAVEYAQKRLQGRALTGKVSPEISADAIIVHPDVRRMLMSMKSLNEGGRAFYCYVSHKLDIAKFSDDPEQQKRTQKIVELLTPVVKAFSTDMGFDTTVMGQQVFGGHGYIRESGQEQLVRDVRIAQIYEGTNGVQALDLVGRKIMSNGGHYLSVYTDEIKHFMLKDEHQNDGMTEFFLPLADALSVLENATQWLLAKGSKNPDELGSASLDYLHLLGYVSYGYMWAMMAEAALSSQSEDHIFNQNKLATARYYFARILPRIHSLNMALQSGSEFLYQLTPEQF